MGRAAFLALAITLAACAKKPPVVFGERMPDGCGKQTRSERCIGWLVDHLLMMVLFKPYHDDEIRQYVASVGERLARTNNVRRKWTFRVIDDDHVNAYSGFNNTIYITRGALGIIRDESELAAVIAHEMGHTLAGHNRESIQDLFREDVGSSQIEEWRQLRYARDDEIQADELEVVMLARAGYDVHASERMLRAFGADEEDEDDSDDRHPIFRERIARAVALAARYPSDGERSIERYNEKVAKLVVGDDPHLVATLDEAVVFARANLAVDLPAGVKTMRLGNMIVFWIDNGVDEAGFAGTMQLIDRRLAKDIKNDKDDKDNSYTEVKVSGAAAIAVTIIDDDKVRRARLAKSVVATTREPRADEIARLHPIRFDPTVPRALWRN